MERNMEIITNSLVKENPVLTLVLGTCPTLAVTYLAKNGLGMGLALFVTLLCANISIAILSKFLPATVRAPAYVTIIAGLVTVIQMLVKAYFPNWDKELGIFLPMIVVNCLILGGPLLSLSELRLKTALLNAGTMGFGFTVILTLMGVIREIIGAGTCFGYRVLPDFIQPFTIMTSAPGGFFVFGLLIAALAAFTAPKKRQIPSSAPWG